MILQNILPIHEAGGRLEVISLYEKFWKFEAEYDAYSRTAFDVYYWPLIRATVFQRLSEARGLVHKALPQALATSELGKTPSRLKKLSQIIAQSIPSQIQTNKPLRTPTAIISFLRRRHIIDGRPVDIYCSSLIDDNSLGRKLIFDRFHFNRPERTLAGDWICPVVAMMWKASLEARLARRLVGTNARGEWESLAQAFEAQLGLKFPIPHEAIIHNIFQFRSMRRQIRSLLRRRGVERLFTVHGTASAPFIAAAHDLGIETYELQHCAASPYSMILSFPQQSFVPYRPQYFLSFSQYWLDVVTLAGNQAGRVFGSKIMEYLRSGVRAPRTRTAVFLSQPFFGGRLIKFFLDIARAALRGAPFFGQLAMRESRSYKWHNHRSIS